MNDNSSILQEIAAHLASSQFNCEPSQLSVSELVTNYYSFVFTVSAANSDIEVFVKIPKTEESRGEILPLSAEDRSLALREYSSLELLKTNWPNIHNVQFITPLEYIEKYNAICTVKINAGDAYHVFRRWHLASLFFDQKATAKFNSVCHRIGASVAKFHLSSRTEDEFVAKNTISKIEKYAGKLNSRSRNCALFEKLSLLVDNYDSYQEQTTFVDTLKGLDVRNILITETDQLFLLDPGLIRRDAFHADLARYLVTHEILFWGSALFAAGARPSQKTTEHFLAGYDAPIDVLSSTTFKILKLKELLKHWSMAYVALRLKQYPSSVDTILSKSYINPFYEREITQICDDLLDPL